MNTKRVECYDFPEFCRLAQEAIQEGYSFDFDSNERYPTSFGGYYNVDLVKKEPKVATEVAPLEEQEGTSETTSEEVEPKVAKRGRKPS